MQLRALGNSDLEVSEVSLGSWLTYSGGVGREQAEACTKAAFDVGITFFDTANGYGRGAAETAWGEILGGYDRDSFLIATKVFMPMSDDPADRGLSARHIAEQVDASLGRLQVDHLDLYQAHRFDPSVAIEETMEAFAEVVDAGKARWIGFSEWTPEQIEAALACERRPPIVSSQPQYSMLWRAPEAELFPLCPRNGISHVVWSPLAEGVLTGKYRPGEAPPQDSRAASEEMSAFIGNRLDDEVLEAVQRLRGVAEDAGLDMATLALAWVLRREEVASTIIGASRPEQVHANAKAAGVTLSADTLRAIDDALGSHPVTEPTLAPLAQEGVTHR